MEKHKDPGTPAEQDNQDELVTRPDSSEEERPFGDERDLQAVS